MLVEQFKRAVLQRCGAGGLHSLGRSFRILDDDGSRQVNINELSSGIADLGFHVEMKDLQILLAAVDKNNSGSLSFEEFVVAVRGDISPRREALINMAFDTLDRTGDGTVQADDICRCYDVRQHPEVQMGVMGEDQALNHFLSQFDSVERDGIVTRREFLEYYRSVSASIDGDDYFELMIRNAWHISGGEGQYQNTANTQVLVTFEDGAQEVVALQHDIGIDLEDPMVVMQHLHAQGVKGAVSYSLGQ
jgi:Ca2+-binding EF-hand superfamily protein